MRVRLMDGDQVIVELETPEPVASRLVLPRASDDGRCICTRPASVIGHFCRQVFIKREIAEDGLQVYRIGPRAQARKLMQPIRATRVS